jgi:hypothetical protein
VPAGFIDVVLPSAEDAAIVRAGILMALFGAGLPMLGVSAPALAARRVAVHVREGGVTPPILRAFGWADAVTDATLSAPPRAQGAAGAIRLELGRAERAFADTRFDEAQAAAENADKLADQLLLADVSAHPLWVRARLFQGRVALARGDLPRARAAFEATAAGAPELRLEPGEYPPHVRKAFADARAAVLARPAERLRVESDPPGAEVELDGRLVGRTPLDVSVRKERCRLVVRAIGRRPAAADCAAGPQLTVRLEEADADTRWQQLHLRQRADAEWAGDQALLDRLLTHLNSDWFVLLAADPSGKAYVSRAYWARGKRWLELPTAPLPLADVAQQLRRAIEESEGLKVRVLESPQGPPELEALAGAPDAIARASLHVRAGGARAFSDRPLRAQSPGVFRGTLVDRPAPGLGIDYFVEGADAQGQVRSRVGSATSPLTHRLPGPTGGDQPPARAAFYQKGWFWAVAGALAVGAGVTTFALTRDPSVAAVY